MLGRERARSSRDAPCDAPRRMPSPVPGTARSTSSPSSRARSYVRQPRNVKCWSPIHCRKAVPSVRSSASIAGGAVRSSSTTCRKRASILSQSFGGRAHVAQHPFEIGREPGEQPGIGLAVDLDVEEGFEHRRLAAVSIVDASVRESEQPPGGIAAHTQDRVHDQVQPEVVTLELHRDRIDEERHVVVHDLDDRVVGVPTVFGALRCEARGRCAAPGARRCARSQWQRATARSSSALRCSRSSARDLARSSSGETVSNAWSSEDTTLRPYPGPAAGQSGRYLLVRERPACGGMRISHSRSSSPTKPTRSRPRAFARTTCGSRPSPT